MARTFEKDNKWSIQQITDKYPYCHYLIFLLRLEETYVIYDKQQGTTLPATEMLWLFFKTSEETFFWCFFKGKCYDFLTQNLWAFCPLYNSSNTRRYITIATEGGILNYINLADCELLLPGSFQTESMRKIIKKNRLAECDQEKTSQQREASRQTGPPAVWLPRARKGFCRRARALPKTAQLWLHS